MRGFLAALLLSTASACWAPAQAHAILVESQPAIGAVVPAGHVVLRLRFNSRIDRARSRLTLVGPDLGTTILSLLPEGTDDLLLTSADLPAGDFMIHWQVLAVDGHITHGTMSFRVRVPEGKP